MNIKVYMIMVIMVAMTGCKVLTVDSMPDVATPDTAVLYDGNIADTFAYEIYEKQFPDTQSEVTYLINLVRYSDLRFCRNGQIYSGEQGAEWLEYKMSLFSDEVTIAEDFATKIASHSRISGKPYYIAYPNDTKCLMTTAFLNELARLREKEKIQ